MFIDLFQVTKVHTHDTRIYSIKPAVSKERNAISKHLKIFAELVTSWHRETLYKWTRPYIDYLSLWIDYGSEISSSSPFIKLHIDLNFVVRVGAFWIRLPCFGAIWSSAHDLLFHNTSQEVMNETKAPKMEKILMLHTVC